MDHWLYTANLKLYDVKGALAGPETFWPMNSRVAVGDRLFLYLAAPEKRIAYDCAVTAIDLAEDQVIDALRPYFRETPPKGGKPKKFMALAVRQGYAADPDGPLALSALRTAGLNGMLMGPRRLDNNPPLLAHILEHAE